MNLEADKRKVEEQLAAERRLALDKDALLERSKKREAELEEDVLALQADLDTVDSQLERVQAALAETVEKYEKTKEAFAQASEHLVRLEAEQRQWQERSQTMSADADTAREHLEALHQQRAALEHEAEEDWSDWDVREDEDGAEGAGEGSSSAETMPQDTALDGLSEDSIVEERRTSGEVYFYINCS